MDIPLKTTDHQSKQLPRYKELLIKQIELYLDIVNKAATLAETDQGVFDIFELYYFEGNKDTSFLIEIIEDLKEALIDYGIDDGGQL